MTPARDTLIESLRGIVNGIRTDIRATSQQVHDVYDGDKRQQALSDAASLVAQVAELGLDQMDAALDALLREEGWPDELRCSKCDQPVPDNGDVICIDCFNDRQATHAIR